MHHYFSRFQHYWYWIERCINKSFGHPWFSLFTCTCFYNNKKDKETVNSSSSITAFSSYCNTDFWKIRIIQKNQRFFEWTTWLTSAFPTLRSESAKKNPQNVIFLCTSTTKKQLQSKLLRCFLVVEQTLNKQIEVFLEFRYTKKIKI